MNTITIMSLICPRCHFGTNKKGNFEYHLNKGTPCACQFSNIAREDILVSLAIRSFDCPQCNRTFSGSRYLTMHKKTCNRGSPQNCTDTSGSILVAMQKQLAEVTKQLQYLQENQQAMQQPCQVNNNIQNNITNIIINTNDFGSEDRSYITDEDMQSCLDAMHLSPLVDQVYFNPEHPENHTVKLKSEKRGRMWARQEGVWIEVDMNASIDTMMDTEFRHLCKFFLDGEMKDETIDLMKRSKRHNQVVNLNTKNSVYYALRRSIQAKIKNALVALVPSLPHPPIQSTTM